jgi:hypothetical protein
MFSRELTSAPMISPSNWSGAKKLARRLNKMLHLLKSFERGSTRLKLP